MSGPRRRKRARRRRQLSRRGFLAALVTTPVVASCGDNLRPGIRPDAATGNGDPDAVVDAPTDGPAATGTFVHGVASGDPLSDRVLLWTRVTTTQTSPVPVSYVVARDPALTDVVVMGIASATSARDFTVKVDVTGLAAATTYYYRFNIGAVLSPIGRTRTLPAGTVPHLRIGVVSCASYAHGLFNAYRRVAARADLDLVIHVGDYVYEYSSGADGKETYGTARTYEPPTEIVSLADYRTRFAQYRRDADLQELHRQHAIIAIPDDHETADNSWRDGALNHGENGSNEGLWATRVSAALQAYFEWMPIREPTGDARATYRQFSLGDLVDLFMLESRVAGRDQPIAAAVTLPPPFPSQVQVFADSGAVAASARTMLGSAQEAWLDAGLRASQAKWRLLGQGTMFGQLKVVGGTNASNLSFYLNPDQWDGYPRARDRMFALFEDATLDNVVILTGDIHTAWSLDLSPDPNNSAAYNSSTGAGSRAVEFVATSVTAPGIPELASVQSVIPSVNPHIKFVELDKRGYLLLDIMPDRVVGEHWFVATIDTASNVETFGAAHQTEDGENHLTATTQTTPRSNPPALAP